MAENAPKPPVTTVGAAVGFTNAAALSLAKLASASFSTRAAERDDDPLQRQTRREGSAVLSRFIKAIANMPPGGFGHKLGESMREWLLMLIPFALVLYFVVFPDQFSVTFHWLGQLFFQ